jgi:putative polyhydroxyalkanoate system protein
LSDILITQPHQLSLQQARDAAQQVAERMAEEFDMTLQWQGDLLSFERSGVSGSLAVGTAEAKLQITLGLFFQVFAAKIEEKAARHMKKMFEPALPA